MSSPLNHSAQRSPRLSLGCIQGNPPFLNENTFGPVIVEDSFWMMGACVIVLSFCDTSSSAGIPMCVI